MQACMSAPKEGWLVDLDKLQDLIRIFETSSLSEIEIEESGRRMRLRKARPVVSYSGSLPVAPPQEVRGTQVVLHESAVPSVHPTAPAPAKKEDEGLVTIDSPMVGVFYAAPAPGEPPFVAVGDTVDEQQTVCIVEAMKLMNEIEAEVKGRIKRILVENAQPVEYDQPLFVVETE